MKTIEISTAVFAKIWSLRQDGEEAENEILDRVLHSRSVRQAPHRIQDTVPMKENSIKEALWRDDICEALRKIGGEGDLAEIYRVVRDIRKTASRSLPTSTEAVIRRELENNSSDSESFTGHRNLFRSVNGIGGGRWALR